MSLIARNLSRSAAVIGICLLFVSAAVSQTAPAVPTDGQIIKKVDEYMKAAMRADSFSGSVLVARNGKPIISKGFGLANIELAVPNTPKTVFRLGSITKQFTSMAIMILQERGKLSVSDPVCKYFADCPAAWQPITVRHLLTHTSGIPNFTSFPDFVKSSAIATTTTDLIGRFKDKPLDFVPGEKYAYSNSGYYLLGVIIEKASGKAYAEFLHESIFGPLGMVHSGYDDPVRIIKDRAAGYTLRDEGLVNCAPIDMSTAYAAGALYSNVEDLLIWDQALYTEKLVSNRSLDEMFTPLKGSYGYGWSISKKLERRTIAHGGNIYGFSTYISRFPAEKLTFIVLSNNEGTAGGEIADDLASIVFGAAYTIPKERKAVAVDIKKLERLVGRYQITPNVVMTVSIENGRLMGELGGQPKFQFYAESETVFFMKTIKGQVTFNVDVGGETTGLTLRIGKNDIPATKLK